MLLRQLLLPDPPRRLPHARFWNVASRSAHLAATGVLLGGHVFAVSPERLRPWLWMSVATGATLLFVEAYKSIDWFLEGAGIALLLKLALLCCVLAAWEWRVPILFAVVGVASIGAHMPGRVRHYSLWHKRNMKAG